MYRTQVVEKKAQVVEYQPCTFEHYLSEPIFVVVPMEDPSAADADASPDVVAVFLFDRVGSTIRKGGGKLTVRMNYREVYSCGSHCNFQC